MYLLFKILLLQTVCLQSGVKSIYTTNVNILISKGFHLTIMGKLWTEVIYNTLLLYNKFPIASR